MAKAVSNYPMVRHVAARFKALKHFRLEEIVAMDTIFLSIKAIGGARCAQMFYGLKSHRINVYGMESKSQVPEVYQRFLRDEGVPSGIHRDQAPEQKEALITRINREHKIQESFTKAGNPHQNPVES
jgi:hypothetical protein